MSEIKTKNVETISEILDYISSKISLDNTILAFRGETKDYGSTKLLPAVYRDSYINSEDKIFRESQRFNNQEFLEDQTAFDKLSRIQHYSAPTRLLDISEDLMSALYFATEKKQKKQKKKQKKENSILYIFEIQEDKIKYYDSDTVSVISNLAKIPLDGCSKSKRMLLCNINMHKKDIKKFNKTQSAKFLRHEIREEKPQFEPIINPEHLISIQCVRPKLTSGRIKSQKGFFLLFGLNPDDVKIPIQLIDKHNKLPDKKKTNHPIKQIHKLTIKSCCIKDMKEELEKIGIKKSFIYPEIDKVSEYLKDHYKKENK
jgi:hypothetical protein